MQYLLGEITERKRKRHEKTQALLGLYRTFGTERLRAVVESAIEPGAFLDQVIQLRNFINAIIREKGAPSGDKDKPTATGDLHLDGVIRKDVGGRRPALYWRAAEVLTQRLKGSVSSNVGTLQNYQSL